MTTPRTSTGRHRALLMAATARPHWPPARGTRWPLTHSPGRPYFDRKIAEGKTPKEALRALKRRISDALYTAMVADARHSAAMTKAGPGGQSGNDSDTSAAGSHPETPALRSSHSRTRTKATTTSPPARRTPLGPSATTTRRSA